ncbi:MAG: hypothetical protein LBG28_06020 [Tannerella sp.]|jgi:hypothetical protein|nr:hypothetical protein [Tannerella sp.]
MVTLKKQDMEDKNYWFSLKSHVYVEFKKNRILLYDTYKGNHIETELRETVDMVSQLYEPQNLGVIFLTKEMQKNVNIRNFIQNVLMNQMGDLTDVDKMPDKPVSLLK